MMEATLSVKTPRADEFGNPRVAVRVDGISKHFGSGERRSLRSGAVTWEVYAGQMSLIVGPVRLRKDHAALGDRRHPQRRRRDVGDDFRPGGLGDERPGSDPVPAQHIGFVFQQYNLLPALTAAENASVPLVIAGWSKAKAVDKAKAVLDSLGMGKKVDSFPNQLSGGQQQRVAISRALVHEPNLLVCDEPTAALDHETGHSVMELMREAAVKPDRAVVVVTHDNRVFHFGDRIAHMDDGRIVQVEDKTQAAASSRIMAYHGVELEPDRSRRWSLS